ncbi:MAG: prepilin-type N-terminal cleavage/methylation domain-containing protein [Planctomycetota bacterium]
MELQRAREAGYTLLEMTIALAVTMTLIVAVLTIGAETARFSSYADQDFTVQFEANRAFTRISELMRKTGWSTQGTTNYPLVNVAEDEIEFRLLDDIDGNGYPFDATTGDLEWDTDVFTISRNPVLETLFVYDDEDNPVWTLGRYVQSVRFQTINQDAALHLKEVRVEVVCRRTANDGNDIEYTAAGSVHMRN